MRLWALVTSALRMMKVSPCVGGCHVRGSPLLPLQGVPCLGGLGGMGPSYQGPHTFGTWSGLFLRVFLSQRSPSSLGAVGVLLRALGTWGLPAGEHPEVPHQCPRMGLGVDEDGPPLS